MTQPVDILETGRRPYFRMSEAGTCDLVIGHRIKGTQERRRYDGVLAMAMGKALEPVINQYLIAGGMSVAFHNADQLEVAAQDPYRIGHPDGIGWVPDGNLRTLSLDLMRILTPPAKAYLESGLPVVVEAKTMNDASFKSVLSRGLDATSLTSHYPDQTMEYVGAIRNPENDEIWWEPTAYVDRDGTPLSVPIPQSGARVFKEWLAATELPGRPEASLLVGFNTARKQILTELIPFDSNRYAQNTARFDRIANYLHAGELPPPSLDGKAADCYFCPFSYLCPAVDQLRRTTILDDGDLADLDISAPTDFAETARMNELAAEYMQQGAAERLAKARKEEIRDEMLSLLEPGVPVYAIDHRVKFVETKGRNMIDEPKLKELADAIGFEIPRKLTAPSKRIYVSRVTGSEITDEGGE